jgi:hypothetical protein
VSAAGDIPGAAAPPALLKLLRELPGLELPPRGDLTVEAWLAKCRETLPCETWLRVAMAVL